MSVTILRANALALPLADSSVDLVVTSPPYFGLRSYQDGGKHYEGQIGSEATPAEFVDALIAATREMVRVLKPSGSIWVNLGDKYAGSQPSATRWQTASLEGGRGRLPELAETHAGVPDVEWGTVRTKSLLGIPWRYAIRCIDELGLILRAEVIWSKPNGLPESVTDRVRRSHEQWFHFTLNPRYFSAVDEIREPHAPRTHEQAAIDAKAGLVKVSQHRKPTVENRRERSVTPPPNPLGKMPGSVWTIATEPLSVPDELGIDHFAAFPTEWPRRIIQGWSPREVCTACGEGRRPVSAITSGDFDSEKERERLAAHQRERVTVGGGASSSLGRRHVAHAITGYACACPDTSAPATPGVVLDPFGGTGTTALVADVLGRDGISVDLSADYCRLAEWRTTDPKQRAKAARVEAVEPVPDDQLSLFEESA